MSRPQDPDRGIARDLRLRAAPPAVARLSRRSLVLLAAVSAVALAAVLAGSLGAPRRRPPPAPTAVEAPAPPPAGLAILPRDYTRAKAPVPRLGPPLPGDLGRPLLALGQGAPAARPAPDPAVQQALAEAQQARTSRLAVPTTPGPPGGAASALPPEPPAVRPEGMAPTYGLAAGTVVRAALVTGLRSDLPGPVVAQVTEAVTDSATGRRVLIPQGARLIGAFETPAVVGQRRLPVAWTQLILPDGRSVDLGGQPATDPEGYAGLADQVDHRWRSLAGAAVLSTLLGVGAELGAGPGDSRLLQALRDGTAGGATQAGQQLVGRSLALAPVLTVRPGYPVRLLVTRDLALPPWRPAAGSSR
jgi:type IV secretion system protein VirB10